MIRLFCSWLVETYFATDIWLPEWLFVWARRYSDDGAMSRGMRRWRRKHPKHPSGEPWRVSTAPEVPVEVDIKPVSVHWWVGTAHGEAVLSPGRGKKSVYVRFSTPIEVPYPEPGYSYQSKGEEFDLDTGRRIVWGQGNEALMQDWVLDAADRADILKGGGG